MAGRCSGGRGGGGGRRRGGGGGGGSGHGRGRGRGRGGQPPIPRSLASAPAQPQSANATGAKLTRDARKERRRNTQQAAISKKTHDDDEYFWQMVASRRHLPVPRCEPPVQALFSQQGASGLNFAKYDAIPVTRTGPDTSQVPSLDSFPSLKSVLPPFLHRNLTGADRMAYSVPTPVQRHCIPLSLTGNMDVMACAQTGSGKTIAFLVPLISTISTELGKEPPEAAAARTPAAPSALVVAPTRELASQIELEAHKLCHSSGIGCVCVYGGAPTRGQLKNLAAGVEILVATPGRLNDFLGRGLISLGRIRFLVLDEADRMLDMGFEPQIRQICDRYDLPPAGARRTLMFSATFPTPMQLIAKKYMREYVFVAVGRVGSTTESITQEIVHVSRNDKRIKLDLLCGILAAKEGDQAEEKTIVFTQKKRVAAWVCKQLMIELPNVAAAAIHGDRSQGQREDALAKFRSGVINVLVATDVAARGLDIDDVAQVVQFDLPVSRDDFDSYVHRIGRTGRAGRTGIAIAFFVPGMDAKNGENNAIWQPLHDLLKEAGQTIPQWFLDCRPRHGGGGGGGARRAPTKDARLSQPASASSGGVATAKYVEGGSTGLEKCREEHDSRRGAARSGVVRLVEGTGDGRGCRDNRQSGIRREQRGGQRVSANSATRGRGGGRGRGRRGASGRRKVGVGGGTTNTA